MEAVEKMFVQRKGQEVTKTQEAQISRVCSAAWKKWGVTCVEAILV
jgi:hypothetical protein